MYYQNIFQENKLCFLNSEMNFKNTYIPSNKSNCGLLLVIFGTSPHRNTLQPVIPVCLCLKC